MEWECHRKPLMIGMFCELDVQKGTLSDGNGTFSDAEATFHDETFCMETGRYILYCSLC